jgi:triosephosphate isomerase
MRVKLLAGNWKMNKTNAELPAFFAGLSTELRIELAAVQDKVEVLFAASYTLLQKALELAGPHKIRIAAQNCHWLESGAYTGEISLGMLQDIGVRAVLIGHSERRQYYGETDQSVAAKTKAALSKGITPITCVGETLEERKANKTEAVVQRQLLAVLNAVEQPGDLIIAYEPVWAIGTGHSASSAEAQDVHAFIRQVVHQKMGKNAAAAMRILYGGSANPANIAELLTQPDIDGGLVGGASLKPDDFAKMIRAALEVAH